MAAKKRTEIQREADMLVLAEQKHQGKTYAEIQAYLRQYHGRKLSIRQLKFDMDHLRKQWAKSNIDEIQKMLQEELARISAMENLAWKKFYACTGTRNKETIEQAVPMVKGEDGKMVPDIGLWTGKKRVIISEDSSEDERFWWGQVIHLQGERRKLLGLYRTKIEIDSNVTHSVKGYVGWTPATWDGNPQLESVVVEDGEYTEGNDNETV